MIENFNKSSFIVKFYQWNLKKESKTQSNHCAVVKIYSLRNLVEFDVIGDLEGGK